MTLEQFLEEATDALEKTLYASPLDFADEWGFWVAFAKIEGYEKELREVFAIDN